MKSDRSTAATLRPKGEVGGDGVSTVPASPASVLLPGEFAIRTMVKDTYLTARDGGRHSIDAVITAATTPGPNEKFRLSKIASTNYTTIQTLQAYYVSAVGGGGLGGNVEANRVLQTERTATSFADDALFRLIGPSQNGTTAIVTFNDHFLTALGGGGKTSNAFHTDATEASSWERFRFLKSGDLGSGFRYAIMPAGKRGLFLKASVFSGEDRRRFYTYSDLNDDGKFTLIQLEDGSYALQTSNPANFVTAVGGGGIARGDNLHADATRIGDWEKFKIEDQGNATYTIQTASGFYLAVNPSFDGLPPFDNISTRISFPNEAPQIGYIAKFRLIMIDP